MIRFLFILALISAAFGTVPFASAQSIEIVSETASAELIQDIEAAVKPETAAETPFEARRQARTAAERAQRFLNSRAYFAPEISFSVGGAAGIEPALNVDPGKRFRISALRLEFNGSELPAPVQARLSEVDIAETGQPALPANVIAHETRLVALLRDEGYPDARALERQILGDEDSGTVEVIYRLDAGARVRFGEIVYRPAVPIRLAYLERLVPFADGELYSADALTAYNRRLRDTRMFARSTARLAEQVDSKDSEEGDVERDVEVNLAMRQRYSFGAGATVSTAEGAGLTTELTRHNATRRADTLTGQFTIAQLSRSAEIDWQIPNVFAYDHTVAFTATLDEEETDAFDREAVTVGGAYTVNFSSALSAGFSLQVEFASEIDAFEQRDVQIVSAGGGFRLDRSDDPLDPSRGWRVETRVEPTLVQGDDAANFVGVNSQVSAYQPLRSDGRVVLAGRVRTGAIYGAKLDDVPVSRRFYSGGGGSARGFEFQSVGPEDSEGQPTGGRALFETSAELRLRSPKGFGAALFLDAATVSEDRAIDFGALRTSAGIGVRYATPVGPIRFDLAMPIDREDGDADAQFYISIGQAF